MLKKLWQRLRGKDPDKPIESLDELWYKLHLLPDTGSLPSEVVAPLLKLRQEAIQISKNEQYQAYLIRWLLFSAMELADVEPQVFSLNFESAHGQGFSGRYSGLDLRMTHWAIPVMAESLGRYLIENGGPNYIQTGFQHPSSKRMFSLTLAWEEGKMPALQVQELKTEVAELKAKLVCGQSCCASAFEEEELYV